VKLLRAVKQEKKKKSSLKSSYSTDAMSKAHKDEYAALCENIYLLETSYFEETCGVESHILPVVRVIIPYKRKREVNRDQRIFSLSRRSDAHLLAGDWPESVTSSKQLLEALIDGMHPGKTRSTKK